MRQLQTLICSALIFFSSAASSQVANHESRSIQCSGVYWVLTTVRDSNPDLAKYFMDMGIAYAGVFAEERSKRGLKTTNRDIRVARDAVLKELASQFVRREESVVKEIDFCFTWTKNMRIAGGVASYLAAYPRGTTPESSGPLLDIARAAFGDWVKSGARTMTDTSDQIRRDLQ